MKTLKTTALCFVGIILCSFTKSDKTNIYEMFEVFCKDNGYNEITQQVLQKKVNNKIDLIQLVKKCELIQFGRFTTSDGTDIYIFTNYKSSICAIQFINQACYKYKDGKWEAVPNILPAVSFLDLYGPDQKPPSGFENIGTTRIELNDNNNITLVLEQNWTEVDEQKERILSQAKYSAVRLKWDKKEGVFKIKTWMK